MIGEIRKNLKKLSIVLWLVIAAFIGTIFLVWGRGTITGSSNYIAKVGDVEIDIRSFEKVYNRLINIYRELYKDKFTEELVRQFNLKNQALSMLVDEAIIIHVAKEEGLRVSPEEIAEEISKIDAFKVNGKFSRKRYEEILRLNNLTPLEFEKDIYRKLLIRKLENIIKLSTIATPEELRKKAEWNLEMGKIRYIEADVNDFATFANVTEKEIAAFYSEHREMFRTEEKVAFEYTFVKTDNFIDKVLVTKEDIERYKQRYGEMAKNIKVSDIIKELKREKARKEALKFLKKIEKAVKKNPSSFEAIINENNLPIIKVNLKAVNDINEVPQEVVNTLRKLDKNEVSNIIRTEKGFFIVKVTDKIPSTIQSLDAVRDKIIAMIKEEKAFDVAENWAKGIVKRMNKLGFDKVLNEEKLKYKVKESDLFTRAGLSIDNATYQDLALAALSLKPGEVSYVIERGKLFIFELIDKKKPPREAVEKEMEKIKESFINSKRQKVWNEFINDLRNRIEVKINTRLWEAIK